VPLTFTAALRTTQGGRRYQEDTGLLWPDMSPSQLDLLGVPALPVGHLLALIADGMGGHVAGATASQIAARAFATHFVGSSDTPDVSLLDHFVKTLEAANTALLDDIRRDPKRDGMGTTLLAAYVHPFELGSGLSWISVGDSLLYLWRRGDLARLNEDHSLSPVLDKMVAEGRMNAAVARIDPRRHYLRSALTGGEIEMIDVTPRPLPLATGDIVIVASDGLHTFDDTRLAELITAVADEPAARIAAHLIEAIDRNGATNQDNTTVAAILIGNDAS
jgi:PPM family protein phosphatase